MSHLFLHRPPHVSELLGFCAPQDQHIQAHGATVAPLAAVLLSPGAAEGAACGASSTNAILTSPAAAVTTSAAADVVAATTGEPPAGIPPNAAKVTSTPE